MKFKLATDSGNTFLNLSYQEALDSFSSLADMGHYPLRITDENGHEYTCGWDSVDMTAKLYKKEEK